MDSTLFNNPNFSTLNLDKNFDNDIMWEGQLAIDERMVDAALWVTNSEALDPQKLNQVSQQCQNIHTLYDKAKQALIDYLNKNSTFITHHIKHIPKGEFAKFDDFAHKTHSEQTLSDAPKIITEKDVANFVNLLSLHAISIWITSDKLEDNTIWLDFKLGSDKLASDKLSSDKTGANQSNLQQPEQLLTVRFTLDGDIKEVVWER